MFKMGNYRDKVDSFYNSLLQVDVKISDIKLSDDKWALKEIIGHLIDSASNNHQRFVRLQSGDLLGFPEYDCEEWIAAQKYINMKWDMLITLWYNYNLMLINIIENLNTAANENVWVQGQNVITLEELINDYYKHMELHIEHFNKRIEEINKNL